VRAAQVWLCAAWLAIGASAHAAQEPPQLDQAIRALARQDYMGDTAGPVRLLKSVLAKDPDNVEALWQLVLLRIAQTSNMDAAKSANIRLSLARTVKRIVTVARQRGKEAFAHLVMARYAGYSGSYQRARQEIPAALRLEPDSLRARYALARITTGRGEWDESDPEIEAGIALFEKLIARVGNAPPRYFTVATLHFQIAYALTELNKPRWQAAIDRYRLALKSAPAGIIEVAWAWNNMSREHRKLGQCKEAKAAAEKALSLMRFGAARGNLRYAKFCLATQSLMTTQERTFARTVTGNSRKTQQ